MLSNLSKQSGSKKISVMTYDKDPDIVGLSTQHVVV